MKWIRTLMLALAALVLGLWAFYGERHLDKRAEEKQLAGRLGQFKAEDVDSIELLTSSDTILVTQQQSGWRMLRPVAWPADNYAWQGLVQTILTSDRQRSWHVRSDSLLYYQLDPPRARVIIHFRDKSAVPDTLDVGALTPTDQQGYVRCPPSDSVATTSSNLHAAAVRPAIDFRDKALLAYDPSAVQRVAVKLQRETVVIWREGDRWLMLQPIKRFADADTVNALLNGLLQARAVQFFDRPTSLATYGLQYPAAEMVLTLGRGVGTQSRRLLFSSWGKGTIAPGAGYVVDTDRAVSVMEVNADVMKHGLRPTTAYWDRRLAMFQRHLVNRVVIGTPGKTVAVSMDTSYNWHFVPPPEGNVKRWIVNGIVADMDNVRAKDFAGTTGDFGLEHPQVTVELFHDDTSQARIDIGKARGNLLYARGSATSEVVLVDRSLLGKLRIGVDDLREEPPQPQAASAAP